MRKIQMSIVVFFAALLFFSFFSILIMPKDAMAEEKKEATVLEPIEVIGEKVELFSGKVSTERIEELQPTDIGDLLKKDVEGITIIRRSGAAFDPVLRGLSKDRLNALIDGGFLFGACANRMDPPTFHITPYGVEDVEVTKDLLLKIDR
ncbi:MAG: TonB-dependent receptor plug domain-containing protein [Deltaproteobacteria bacterium]|nr:TonB-dependent receptor plug domain-containing protein [Deltaproteobacteria bacterium]